MSLEQWSAIAQILGAVVGIPSLIFVGIQLFLATKAVRAASSQAHSATYHELSANIVQDPHGFAKIWREGLSGAGGLSDEERVRFFAFVSSSSASSSPRASSGAASSFMVSIGAQLISRLDTLPGSLECKSFGTSADTGTAWNSSDGSAH